MPIDPTTGRLVYQAGRLSEKFIQDLALQYCESTNLQALIRAFLLELEDNECRAADVSGAFDLETSTGASLTAIGYIVGFPREHCGVACALAFGFEAEPGEPRVDVLGWDIGEWANDLGGITGAGSVDYTIGDDEVYRRFLKAKIRANTALGAVIDVQDILEIIWPGDTCVGISDPGTGRGQLDILFRRIISSEEVIQMRIVARMLALPVGATLSVAESNGAPFTPIPINLDC